MLRTSVRLAVAVAAAALLVVGWYSAATNNHPDEVAEVGTLLTIVVVFAQVTGLAMGYRDRRSWSGVFVQVTGIGILAGGAAFADLDDAVAVFAIIGFATATLPAVLLLARSGGVESRAARLLLAAVVLATAVVSVLLVDAAGGQALPRMTWWNTFRILPPPTDVLVLYAVHAALTTAAVTAVAVVLVRRHRTASIASPEGPLVVAGLVWSAVTVARALAGLAHVDWAVDDRFDFVWWAELFVEDASVLAGTALLSVIAWLEFVVPRLRRSEGGLVLTERVLDPGLVSYVRRALGDASARVLYRGLSGDDWLDVDGRPVVIDGSDPDRATTVFSRDGVIVGAIEHDALLASQPEAIELVATTAGLALEHGRLAAAARASTERSRQLTARLVTSPDAARDELRRRLTAGPLRELEEIRAELGAGADITDAARRLQRVAASVREISHGILPPTLDEGGLRGALASGDAPARRFPSAVEVTAYLAGRGDPAARVTDAGDHLLITLGQPLTDESVLDRVAVLGGSADGPTIRIPAGA